MTDEYYDKAYHELMHNYLCSEPDYYELRAKISFLNYFADMDLEGKSLLDYGAGMGNHTYKLSKLIPVVCFDVSQFAVDFCRRKGMIATDKLNELGHFDIIFSAHVFEHLPNPLETLKKLRTHLKDDGQLILLLPMELHRRVPFEPSDDRHLWSWTFRTINNLLDEAGYKVIENSYLPYGTGFHKLKFLGNIDFGIYKFITELIGKCYMMKPGRLMFGLKEMKIVAVKK
jgi:SAM-dependent methyltransferase